MLSIRLAKIGKKNRPAYRLVVANKRSGRDGRPLEILGNLDPHQKNGKSVNTSRLEYWLKKGAQLSPAAAKLVEKKK